MKKFLTMLLALTLFASLLAGCSVGAPAGEASSAEETAASAEETATSETASTVTANADGLYDLSYVGIVFPNLSSDFMVAVSNEIIETLEAKGIRAEVVSSDNDQATQLERVENFAEKGIDGLILFPNGASDIGTTLERLQAEGIRVMVFANRVDKGYDVISLVDYTEQGTISAQMAADWIDETFPDAEPGSIEVGLLTVKMSPESAAVSEAMRKVEEFTDKAKIVDDMEMSFNDMDDVAQNNTEMMLGNHPDIKCIITYHMGQGLAADEVAMRTPSINKQEFAVFANSYDPAGGARLQQTPEGGSVIRGITRIGSGSFAYAADLMTGELPVGADKTYYDPITVVTPENVQDIL